jgi:hypothetical protein
MSRLGYKHPSNPVTGLAPPHSTYAVISATRIVADVVLKGMKGFVYVISLEMEQH